TMESCGAVTGSHGPAPVSSVAAFWLQWESRSARAVGSAGVFDTNGCVGDLVSKPVSARRDDALSDRHRLLAGAGFKLPARPCRHNRARNDSAVVAGTGGIRLHRAAGHHRIAKGRAFRSDRGAGIHRPGLARTVFSEVRAGRTVVAGDGCGTFGGS